MHRILIPPNAIQGDEITVTSPSAVHHLVRVLRVRMDDLLECFDGNGHVYAGRITRCSLRALVIAIEKRAEEPPARVGITLVQSLIQPERFEWVLQKATELGVQRIAPVITSRTKTRPRVSGAPSRVVRWRRIVEEATTQCGRTILPRLDELQQFEGVLKTFRDHHVLMPTLVERGDSLEEHVKHLDGVSEVVILIGPEGDFAPEEVTLAKHYGARTATLGRATLRSETAAIVTLAILQHALGVL